MVKIKMTLANVRRFLFNRTKIIWVRARPPFPRLRPGLDIYWSRHRPFMEIMYILQYINLLFKTSLSNLLTTSSILGHAKKATINDFGAIIGKALETCEKETCTINVLVSLS